VGIASQIHAIGDAAVRAVLSAFDEAAPAELPLMRRVEHAQLVHRDDVPRFAALRVAASIQPVHLRTDAEGARRSWGTRAERAFALADLWRSGALLAFGTDAPVEPPDPWPGIAIAVSRRDASWGDAPPFAPAQALPLESALRAATVGPAMTAGEGGRRGRLVPGAAADLVVLPADVLDEPVRAGGALATARPLLTLLDGEETWRDPAFDA
jgi:predicted amidohydrolase YtcJ